MHGGDEIMKVYTVLTAGERRELLQLCWNHHKDALRAGGELKKGVHQGICDWCLERSWRPGYGDYLRDKC